MGFLILARRDFKAKHNACTCQSIDRKADLPYPKNRPLIDLAATNCLRNNNRFYNKNIPWIPNTLESKGCCLLSFLHGLFLQQRHNDEGNVYGDGKCNAHIGILGLDKGIEQSMDDDCHCEQTKSTGIEQLFLGLHIGNTITH